MADKGKNSSRPVKMQMMRVDNCARLNVREGPSIDNEIVTVLERGDMVKVDPTFIDSKFYKIENGYVMKQFIVRV